MLLFLRGAEMEPERVRSAWPNARFVARARLQPRPVGAVTPPSGTEYETWGILIEAPGAKEQGEERTVVTDDDRRFTAVALEPEIDDAVAVLAAGKYWELPPAYVRRLARVAAAPVEEYFY